MQHDVPCSIFTPEYCATSKARPTYVPFSIRCCSSAGRQVSWQNSIFFCSFWRIQSVLTCLPDSTSNSSNAKVLSLHNKVLSLQKDHSVLKLKKEQGSLWSMSLGTQPSLPFSSHPPDSDLVLQSEKLTRDCSNFQPRRNYWHQLHHCCFWLLETNHQLGIKPSAGLSAVAVAGQYCNDWSSGSFGKGQDQFTTQGSN